MSSTTATALIKKCDRAVTVPVLSLEKNTMFSRMIAYFANLVRHKRSASQGTVPDKKAQARNCHRWADEDQEF